MNPDLEDIQDKIDYLEWRLKNKLEEAASLKKRVDLLRKNEQSLINSSKTSKLIDMLCEALDKANKETIAILSQRPWAQEAE